MQALLLNFRHQGKKAIEKVARNQPAAYLKILALLVPREMKVEHSGGGGSLVFGIRGTYYVKDLWTCSIGIARPHQQDPDVITRPPRWRETRWTI